MSPEQPPGERPNSDEWVHSDERTREDFSMKVGDRQFVVTLLSPQSDRLAPVPALLLAFAGGRESTLFQAPYNYAANAFLAAGHRVLSFDFVGHGERIDHFGEGIRGLRNSLMGGVDPFAVFAEDLRAVIDTCVQRGLATAGHIVTSGTSRGGYMALYGLVHDERIAAAAGFAPVTDWRVLAEFEADVAQPEVAALALSHYGAQAAGRSVFLGIGRQDARVSTRVCVDTAAALTAAGVEVELLLTNDPGHSLGPSGYERGTALLLAWVASTPLT